MSDDQQEATLTVSNKRGLHARASSKLARLAGSFTAARVTVSKNGEAVGATSIMGLMMLGAAKGDSVTIAADGDQATEALKAVTALFEDKFGEGE